ncbi:toll/interleukin-1 receptor domain-containing protein [Mucilaginibacter sp.]
MDSIQQIAPTVFISYAWETEEVKQWVKNLATELRNSGIDAKIDQWEVIPGDQMPHFMEKSVKDNDYVLIICTSKYKSKSENRIGGVGYEGDIMTAEVLQKANHRKFIPILQSGNKDISIPSWLSGKYFVDLSSETHFEKNFEDLITTILNVRERAPELGRIPQKFQSVPSNPIETAPSVEDDKIKIKGILVDEVTTPLNDGTKGSALYKIPFELNKRPDYEWSDLFIQSFNRPPEFTMMHRPGIASVSGNKIYLDGTTIEEVERYHKKPLKLAVEVANRQYAEIQKNRKQAKEREQSLKEQHKRSIDEISRRINFDD